MPGKATDMEKAAIQSEILFCASVFSNKFLLVISPVCFAVGALI